MVRSTLDEVRRGRSRHLLSVHLFGGLRLLALEFLTWRPYQKTLAATAAAAALFVALGFLLNGI